MKSLAESIADLNLVADNTTKVSVYVHKPVDPAAYGNRPTKVVDSLKRAKALVAIILDRAYADPNYRFAWLQVHDFATGAKYRWIPGTGWVTHVEPRATAQQVEQVEVEQVEVDPHAECGGCTVCMGEGSL